jgi:hypothetical protein
LPRCSKLELGQERSKLAALQERYILLLPLEHIPYTILETLSLVNGAIHRKLADMANTYHRRYAFRVLL